MAGRSGNRIPVGARFSAPVHTGPEAHPAFYIVDTGYIPGAKGPGRGVNHPHQSSAEVKERVELYIYSLSGSSWPVLGRTSHFTFTSPSLSNLTCQEGRAGTVKVLLHCVVHMVSHYAVHNSLLSFFLSPFVASCSCSLHVSSD